MILKRWLVFLFATATMFTQIKISGYVIEQGNDFAIALASVSVKGTFLGTITDTDGYFSLEIPNGNSAIIVITSVGYQSAEHNVDAETEKEKKYYLKQDLFKSDEVVVTALSIEAKSKELGVSRSNISSKEISTLPTTDLNSALQGKAVGVDIRSNNGTLGNGMRINMRGVNSINSNTEPLVILDGVILDNSIPVSIGRKSNSEDAGNASPGARALLDINPDDIESVEILKGAAAGSLYGSKAAAGVIIVKTKSGSNRLRINIRSSYSQLNPNKTELDYKKNNWSNADVTKWFSRDYNSNGTFAGSGTGSHSKEDFLWIASGLNNAGQALANKSSWNDYSEYPWQIGSVYKNSVSLSGGKDLIKFYLNASDLRSEGIQRNNLFDKTSARLNISYVPQEKLKLDLSTYYTESEKWTPSGDNADYAPLNLLYQFLPFHPLSTDFFGYRGSEIESVGISETSSRIISSINLSYFINDKLTFNTIFGVDNTNILNNDFQPRSISGVIIGKLRQSSSELKSQTFNIGLNYNDKFNDDLSYKLAAGSQWARSTNHVIGGFYNGLPFIGSTTTTGSFANAIPIEEEYKSVTLGYYFLGTFNFRDKIYLNLGGRYDISNIFDDGFFYPKASINYNFLTKPEEMLSEVNFRIGYGTAGTQPNFNRLGTYTVSNYDGKPGVVKNRPANADLRPEEQSEIEFGMDLGFMKNQMKLELTYFSKKITDLLLFSPTYPTEGGKFVLQRVENVGEMENKGIELSLSGHLDIEENFDWSYRFNLSSYDNKVTKLAVPGEEITNPGYQDVPTIKEGYQVGALFADINGVRQFIGNPTPDYEWSFKSDFTYMKDIGFGFYLNAKQGHYIYNRFAAYAVRSGFGFHKDFINKSPAEGDAEFAANKGRFVEDASFIKLREVYLSYNLPKSISESYKLSKIRVIVSANNIFTITDYTGLDPEVSTNGFRSSEANWTRGVDFMTAPQSRSYNFTVEISF